MTTRIKKLIELAEKATLDCLERDGLIERPDIYTTLWPCSWGPETEHSKEIDSRFYKFKAAARPENLLPILKCAERMRDALKIYENTPLMSGVALDSWPAREALREWDELNAEP